MKWRYLYIDNCLLLLYSVNCRLVALCIDLYEAPPCLKRKILFIVASDVDQYKRRITRTTF